MLVAIPDVLTKEQVTLARQKLDTAQWIDGKTTAGHQAIRTKNNQQLPVDNPVAREVGDLILAALGRNPLFMSAALPLRVLPPMFNRYAGGEHFGMHIDNAIRAVPGTPHQIRSDLSATVFFSQPDEYDGGELMVEGNFGRQSVKLPAGHMVLYPASSVHLVTPVTRGARVSSFFWVQSMIREDAKRTLLFDLDTAIQRLVRDQPEHPSAVQMTGVYHNLVRMWAEL